MQEAALLAASWFGGIALFEVPTGYLADRYGHKASTLLGLATMGVAFVSLAFVSGIGMIVAGLVAAIGATMISGARDAWAFERFRVERPTEESQNFWLNLRGATAEERLRGMEQGTSNGTAAAAS